MASGSFTVATASVAAAYAAGTAAATGISAAFRATPGGGVWLKIYPDGWPSTTAMSGTYIAMKSTDEGATWLPLSASGSSFAQFAAPAVPVNEVISGEDVYGALYRLACTVAPTAAAQHNYELNNT